VTSEIIDAMLEVPRVDIPDMPDRIVAATTVYFGVPAIGRDGRIRAASLKTVERHVSMVQINPGRAELIATGKHAGSSKTLPRFP